MRKSVATKIESVESKLINKSAKLLSARLTRLLARVLGEKLLASSDRN